MKLPGITWNTQVQSLGRDDPRGPVRVARAQAAVAEKQIDTTRQVANDLVAIGKIHRGTAREVDAYHARENARADEFGRNMMWLSNKGMALTADIIKADATADYNEFMKSARMTTEGMVSGQRTMSVLRDENDPSQGHKVVSMHGALVSSWEKSMGDMREAFLNQANPWARNLLAQKMDDYIAEQHLNVVKTSNDWARSFARGQVMEQYNDLLLDKQYAAAKTVIDENAGLFSGEERAGYEMKRQVAMEQHDQELTAFNTATEIIGKGLTFEQQMAQTNGIQDKDVRAMVRAELEHRENLKRDGENRRREMAKRDAEDGFMAQVKAVNDGKMSAADIQIPVTADPNTYKSLTSYRKSLIEGDLVPTDATTDYRLSNMAADNPQQFIKADLLAYRDRLSDQDFDKYVNMQRTMKSGGEAKELKFTKVTKDTLNVALGGIGLDSAWIKDNPEKYAQMYSLAQREMEYHERTTGKEMTPAQQGALYKRLFHDVITPGFFDSTFSLKDVADDRLNAYADMLRSQGKTVSAESIQAIREDFMEYRNEYADLFENAGVSFTEPELVDLYQVDTYLAEMLRGEGKKVTSASRAKVREDYFNRRDEIDAALIRAGVEVTPQNRATLYKRARGG